MLAVEAQPHLRVIHLGGTIEKVSSLIAVGKFAAEHQAILNDLKQKRNAMELSFLSAGLGVGVGIVLLNSAMILMAPALKPLIGILQGLNQRIALMEQLIEAFEDEDIHIAIGLQTEGLREIDFLLRFPDKEFILIQIRSLGKVIVKFSEQHDALRFRQKREGGGLKTWKPDPLAEIIEQERWLRRERSDLLGGSARDKRRPIAKLLVLANETILGDHPEHLYATMNNQRYVTIRRSGTTSIVVKTQVIDFIRDYLQSRRSTKDLNN